MFLEIFGVEAEASAILDLPLLHRKAFNHDVPITTVSPDWFGAELVICGESGFPYLTSIGVQRIIICASEVTLPTALLPPGAEVRTCIMNYEFDCSEGHRDPEEAPIVKHMRQTLEWCKGKKTCAACSVGFHRSAPWIVGALMASGWSLNMACDHIEDVRPGSNVSKWSTSKKFKERASTRERWKPFERAMQHTYRDCRPFQPIVLRSYNDLRTT